MPLQRNPNLTDGDSIYNTIIDAHRGLNDAESAALNARLVLLLARQLKSRGTCRRRLVSDSQAATVPALTVLGGTSPGTDGGGSTACCDTRSFTIAVAAR